MFYLKKNIYLLILSKVLVNEIKIAIETSTLLVLKVDEFGLFAICII
ncbi:hypothetical protein FLAVO9AF_170134 [Flavobacterium sp. 9AF]|nr:hypothetical protein FLAVO9AF_170134 [Flavobacterium sp. 9AF]